MTPERLESLERQYESAQSDANEWLPPIAVAPDVFELIGAVKAAREVVEAARRYISTPTEPGNWDEERAGRHHILYEALKRHDEAAT